MKIYLYFKKYYIAMGNGVAMYLDEKGMPPNTASILSLFIIFPMFCVIYFFVDNIIIFTISIFLAINIKLVLNAIDGIIARRKKINTKLGMFLNVGTDIGPDLFIIYLILSKLGLSGNLVFLILGVISVYLFFEFLIIKFYNTQNLFFGGKESRTFFYILIFILYYFKLDFVYLLYFYLLIFIIHNVGFFITEYRK